MCLVNEFALVVNRQANSNANPTTDLPGSILPPLVQQDGVSISVHLHDGKAVRYRQPAGPSVEARAIVALPKARAKFQNVKTHRELKLPPQFSGQGGRSLPALGTKRPQSALVGTVTWWHTSKSLLHLLAGSEPAPPSLTVTAERINALITGRQIAQSYWHAAFSTR